MEHFQVNLIGKTLQITLNKPKQANSFSIPMYKALQKLIEDADNNPQVHSILITANGKHFTSGNDLNNFSHYYSATEQEQQKYAKEMSLLVRNFADSFLECKKPLIACCQGGVIGFFFPLLAMFDQVFITDNTYFFAPMLLFAQSIEMFSSYTFPRIFGQSKAFDLLIKCSKLNAKEAIHFGFAAKSFENQELMIKYAHKYCEELNELKFSALVKAKQFLINPIKQQLKDANLKETQNLESIWSSKELLNDVGQYMQKLKAKM